MVGREWNERVHQSTDSYRRLFTLQAHNVIQHVLTVMPRGWSGGVNFQCRGVLLIWIIAEQGTIALAIGVRVDCLDTFFSSIFYLFFRPL